MFLLQLLFSTSAIISLGSHYIAAAGHGHHEEGDDDEVMRRQRSVGQKCGHLRVGAMEPFSFVPEGSKEKEYFMKAPGIAGKGAFSQVYVGYRLGKTKQFDQATFSKAKCVAIKLTPKNEEINRLVSANAFAVIRAIKTELSKKRRRHIINVHLIGETGDTPETGNFVIIMELAKGDYAGAHIFKDFPVGSDSKELRGEMRKLIVPLQEAHQVFLYLDLQPPNYMYVENPLGVGHSDELKLIDFDGSRLLDDHNGLGPNSEYTPLWSTRPDTLVGPEYEKQENVKVTAKTDMWAVGMMPYYLWLRQPRSNWDNTNGWAMMSQIASIYRGFWWQETDRPYRYYNRKNQFDSVPLVYNIEWLTEYAGAVRHILELRHQYPDIFILVANLMEVDGKVRMDASGALNYLEDKCKPPQLQMENQHFVLFKGVSTSVLKTMLKEGEEENHQGYKELVQLMDQGDEGMAKELANLAKLHTVCAH